MARVKKKSSKMISVALSGASSGVKNFLIPAVDSLVAARPEFMASWLLIKGFFGVVIDLQQEKVNELVEFLKENREVFTKEIVETTEFREGFIISFEQYIKQRTERKRKIIKRILIDFTNTANKEDFKLEIMYDLLNKLTTPHILLLKKFESSKKLFSEDTKIIVHDYEREKPDFQYDYLKYLEYLGLIKSKKDQSTDVDSSDLEDIDISLNEREIFSLSELGKDFESFISE